MSADVPYDHWQARVSFRTCVKREINRQTHARRSIVRVSTRRNDTRARSTTPRTMGCAIGWRVIGYGTYRSSIGWKVMEPIRNPSYEASYTCLRLKIFKSYELVGIDFDFFAPPTDCCPTPHCSWARSRIHPVASMQGGNVTNVTWHCYQIRVRKANIRVTNVRVTTGEHLSNT